MEQLVVAQLLRAGSEFIVVLDASCVEFGCARAYFLPSPTVAHRSPSSPTVNFCLTYLGNSTRVT
jgi:hypothetical protein